MPLTKYLNLSIDSEPVDLKTPEDLPFSISFLLEDIDNFQDKKSSEAFDIQVPATINNDRIFNTLHNPGVNDLSPGQIFKAIRKCVIESNGIELLVGKALLKNVTRQWGRPQNYTFNSYGANGDWIIDLKDATLYDFLRHITFVFNQANVEASWAYDGTSEALPYVFAPIKWGNWMNDIDGDDSCYSILQMKPSLSVYWILYWGFKSLGYKIQSEFFNTDFFRRLTMPWTWGNFLNSEGTKYEQHRFLAKSVLLPDSENGYFFTVDQGQSIGDFIDANVSNDSTLGAFDNNDPNVAGGDYTYVAKEMIWKYNVPDFGTLNANLALTIFYQLSISGGNSDMRLEAYWFKNGVQQRVDSIVAAHGPVIGTNRKESVDTFFFGADVVNGDTISCKLKLRIYRDKTIDNVAYIFVNVEEFKLDYFRIPLGGTIIFDNYTGLQKYKFLDLVKGILDTFNICTQTDSINKVVLMEPAHPYSLTNNLAIKSGGYFNGNTLDWTQKRDLTQESPIDLYSDNEREFIFMFNNDGSDGPLKIITDRNTNIPGAGKYVFPARFKVGKKEYQNTFFAPTMHYDVQDFKAVTGIAPQMIVIVPENISNTSHGEAGNAFAPKLNWYKGLVSGVGGWRWRPDPNSSPSDETEFPFQFAVNYKDGGENDPILSYCDENIGLPDSIVVGKGLLKRFFCQRLAIISNGIYLTDSFSLKNVDIINFFHREMIVIDGQRWELVQITNFNPVTEKPTQCSLRLWAPVSSADNDNTFPSATMMANGVSPNSFDIKYCPLKCLYSDIPKPQ